MPQQKSKTTKKTKGPENWVRKFRPHYEITNDYPKEVLWDVDTLCSEAPTDPWAALDAIVGTTVEPTGPEWFTWEPFAARYGISRASARERLAKLTAEGKLERWKGLSAANKRTVTKWRVKAR